MNILVIGKAKTGTSIVSKAIQNSIIPCDYHLEPKDGKFFFDPKNSQTKKNQVIKIIFEHWNSAHHLRAAIINNQTDIKFSRKIIIVRDPRDEMISRLMYRVYGYVKRNYIKEEKFDFSILEKWKKILIEKEENPSKYSFLRIFEKSNEIFENKQRKWSDHLLLMYSEFIKNAPRDCYILKYEDFIQNKIIDLVNYLDFDIVNKVDEKEALIQRTKRSASHGNWKEYFTEEDVFYFRKSINHLLMEMGYFDWELQPKKKLDSSIYSEYVDRLANMAISDIQRETLRLNDSSQYIRIKWLRDRLGFGR